MDDDDINIDFSKIKNIFKKKKKDSEEVKIVKEEVQTHVNNSPQETVEKEQTPKVLEEEEKSVEIKKESASIDEDDDDISFDFSKVKKAFKQKVDDDEDDSDVSIDFSKVKNIFKSDKTKNTSSNSTEEEDDDISFDFSKVKNMFKKKESTERSDEEIDLTKFTGFISKHKKALFTLLLILIPLIFSISLRSIPGDLPITDNWATSTVSNGLRQQIVNDVRSQYPNLPQQNVDSLVNEQLVQLLESDQFKSQVEQGSQFFRSRLQQDEQTYLLAIDPYFWLRHTENVLENGHPGDELRNKVTGEVCERKSSECVPWDTHMFAPLGRQVPQDTFHAYFQAFFHRIFSFFDSNRTVMSTAFIMPILIAALSVIPAFFIARRIGGDVGGLVAAFFIAVHPAFLTRTAGGFSDTDAYNVFFPLLITWIFLEAFEAKSWKKAVVLTTISGFLVSLFMLSWTGWWYIFDFLIISTIAYIIMYILINRSNLKGILKKHEIRHSLLVLGSFFVASLIFGSLIADFRTFIEGFGGPLFFIRLKEVGITSVWPNVLTTVAEQNTASLNGVINQIGMNSLLLFFLSLMGMIFTLVKSKGNKRDFYFMLASGIWLLAIIIIRPQNLLLFLFLISVPLILKLVWMTWLKESGIDAKLAIILIIWFTSTLFASTKGIRFTLLLVPAFSISAGIAFGLLHKFISRYISKNLDLNKMLTGSIILVLLLLLLISPFRTARATASQEIPSMNDAWYEALDRINREAEPDAIINSWWDFGHWFKAIGKRAVTFDGTSQNTPMAHWIGHSLLTNDEDKAIGILRMLDCGSNNAFKELDKEIEDTAMSVQMLHEIVVLNEEDARDYLLNEVSEETTNNVLKFTHCDPPENYYITSDDMIGKSGVWAHFGIWNFNRASIYNTLNKPEFENDRGKSVEFMVNRFNLSEERANSVFDEVRAISSSEQANSWIAPWPSYSSGISGCTRRNESVVDCPVNVHGVQGTLGMQVDIDKKEAIIITPRGDFHPNTISIPTEDDLVTVRYDNNTIGFSVTMIPAGSNWNFVLMAHPLEDSMFTRLFFLDGHGLSKFKKFSDERSVLNQRIVVWKVDWEGEEKIIHPSFREEEEVVEELEEGTVGDTQVVEPEEEQEVVSNPEVEDSEEEPTETEVVEEQESEEDLSDEEASS